MDSPIREKVRLSDWWHSRPISKRSSSVFVPPPWSDKHVVLEPNPGEQWTAVEVEGQQISGVSTDDHWQAGEALVPGQWNTVSVEGGEVAGAELVASHPFLVAGLEARCVADRTLSVRVRLDGPTDDVTGLFTIYFSLSAADGRQIGCMDVTIGRKTRDMSVEMTIPERLSGAYRLKASLCEDETVIDNARIDIDV